jgi:predicted nucleotidyltransferase
MLNLVYMPEAQPPVSLEHRRFALSPEAFTQMKNLHEKLAEVRREMPEIQGLAFFGSRTTGLERSDPNNPSDLDLIVFYDGSALVPTQKTMIMEKGRLVVNKLAKEELGEKRWIREALINKIEASYNTQLEALGLPIDRDQETGRNKTVQIIDISPQATDRMLRYFIDEINRDTNYGKQPLKLQEVSNPTFKLLSRFYLAVGDGIYKNRKYILDQLDRLEQQGEEGERYFKVLMEYLQYSERTKTTTKRTGIVPYQNYPKSIAEAREYFLTKP